MSAASLIAELGTEIERSWRNANYDSEAFAAIAAEALESAELSSRIDPWEVTRWGWSEPVLPGQRDPESNFGDLALTLYNGNRFHIDVYFWLDGTTSIHEHSFSGAFQVLDGSSLHSTFAFEERHRANTHLLVGELTSTGLELLATGSVRRIDAGASFIHSLFHLDRPSVSLVVRTAGDIEHQPQYRYSLTGLATDPFFNDPRLTKTLQTLRLLIDARRSDVDEAFGAILESADLPSSLPILDLARSSLGGAAVASGFVDGSAERDRFDQLLTICENRHGPLAAPLRAAYAEHDRTNDLIRRRQAVQDSELRFFLALMLNLDHHDAVVAMVSERFPVHDPVDKILDWVGELGRHRIWGTDANALGLDGFAETDVLLLEDLLLQRPVESSPTVDARLAAITACPALTPLLCGKGPFPRRS